MMYRGREGECRIYGIVLPIPVVWGCAGNLGFLRRFMPPHDVYPLSCQDGHGRQ